MGVDVKSCIAESGTGGSMLMFIGSIVDDAAPGAPPPMGLIGLRLGNDDGGMEDMDSIYIEIVLRLLGDSGVEMTRDGESLVHSSLALLLVSWYSSRPLGSERGAQIGLQ